MQLALLSHAQCLRKYSLPLQRAYTKEALDNFANYTSVVDTPDIVLAKINSVNQSDVCTFLKSKLLLLELVDELIAFAKLYCV